ncbi:NAD(+)--arginine ADP-ribosyltransferase [Mycobacterium sp. WUMAC-067]|uniref:putative adhesin n=1 Tax=unclassified Mycobacterium TaxID=2642494 RepID=UPI001CDA2F66|nr:MULTISPECIES: NAD(+)--arginine ADP-ribosyltransferase [unclassified Mycobacterium]MCA2242699.1 NAD(+)--arginine ADP-ribosyltransferase [Mycobacterium sp. WUMAC-067]MCA2315616.1 NAD(+)--arginine ADP-ribosyltransferase [Mycobacterium sp. WUMAC-025]
MAPLACDPTALDRAGATVLSTGVSLGSVISTLTTALAGSAGMAGDDPVGASLGRAYNGAAAKVIEAMTSTRNGLCSIGDGVRMSAHNYALAEAMSDVTGRAGGLPTPPVTAPLAAASHPPSAVGAGSGAPAGWSWVAPYIGMIWPTGDSAKLRAAAAAWTTAGVNFMTTEIAAGGGTMAAIAAQQIPEAAAINKALADASGATNSVARQCQTIAAQLNSYAAKIDQVHAAILDLLSRICDPLTGIKEVWDLLTDEDEDEIKRIADDIKTVVDSFSREAETLGGQIEATMSAAATAAEDMAHWAGKEWDHFLHGTPVGRALNQVGQTLKGVGIEGYDFLEQLAKFSPNRLQTDPIGYAKDVYGMASGAAPLVGLGPDGGPGVADSWKALGKDVTHWDEWGKNPAEALGKSLFDVATLALPGGPLSKVGKAGSRAADVLKGLKKPPEIPKPPSIKPPEVKPPEVKPPEVKPPEVKPPEPGHPAPAPSGKPAPGPADGPLPHSPTESKPPVGGTPHSGEPKPIAVPPESGGKPPVSAPAEATPSPYPQPHEPATRVPPTVPPAAAPAASTPAASMPAASAPSMPSMPSLPEPPSVPSVPAGGLPAETPPGLGEVPHGGEPAAHPPEPRSAGPHPPGDGNAPHLPGDGAPPSDSFPKETPKEIPPSDGQPPDQGEHQPGELPGHGIPHDEMPQGEKHTISGHGSYDPGDGFFTVPKGSSITTFAEHGSTITDSLGNLIETGGDTSGVYSKTFKPGELIPNYTIHPPDGLNILGSPLTVTSPTLISKLIHENMGLVDLAVCTFDPTSPTGKIYHVNGIYDKFNEKFTPYERYKR